MAHKKIKIKPGGPIDKLSMRGQKSPVGGVKKATVTAKELADNPVEFARKRGLL